MAKKQPASPPESMAQAFHMVMTFFVIMFVNAVVVFLGNRISPQHLVVGNMSLSLYWATAIFSGLLSLVVTFIWPFVREVSIQRKKDWSPAEMMGIYFVINFVSIWLITRNSHIFGVGVTSKYVVLVLAFTINFLQGISIVLIDKMNEKK